MSDATREAALDHARETPRALVQANPWEALRRFTDARIALGRVGASLPTAQVLDFGVAHALARDAVYAALDVPQLAADLTPIAGAPMVVRSAAADRRAYLLRPDRGRVLHPHDVAHDVTHDRTSLRATDPPCDVVFVLADGLSAVAVQHHAVPLLAELLPLLPQSWRLSPPVTVLLPEMSARLAKGDSAGAHAAQNRAAAMSLLLTLPFMAAFLVSPATLMRAVFAHGAFDGNAATMAAVALA